jgi:glycosyltransferase involved in cell wall biosynthesis
MRDSFGFPKDAFILVTVSRFVKKNGLADVVNALPLLPKNVCLLLCGFGNLESSLRKLVKKLSLEHRVRFFGACSHADLPAIISSSDVFIRPSLSEGLGNAFLESMACGTPVIGTPVGGIPDFLEDEKTGFFCLPEHPESIRNTVIKVMYYEKEKLSQIKKAAKDLVVEKYNWQTISRDMLILFQKLCEKK